MKSQSAIVLSLLAAGLSAWGQTVGVVAQPVRVTVPVGTTQSNGVSFTATVADVLTPVQLSIPSLPAGAGYLLDTNDFLTNATGVLTLNTTNIAEGVHPFTLTASGGAANSLNLNLQSAHIWTGATFTNGGTADFSDAGNWLNGNVPGSTSDVVLMDSSGQPAGSTTNNIVISANTEIGSLREAITAGDTRQHNIQIDAGVTFKITGPGGLSMLRDRSDTWQEWRLVVAGEQGTLMVSNQNASIRTFSTENQNGQLLLNGLGTLIADVHQIHISDYSVYPGFDSLKANGYVDAALPRRMPPGYNYLARTNIIRCGFAGDPNDWNDPTFRFYSMVVGNNERYGTTQRQPFRLGISNVFLMNSICFGHAGVSMDGNGAVVFNPAFTASNCVAIFRGSDGGRMAVFALADNAAPDSGGSHSKAVLDFSGGTVDALVDRLYLSRNRTNSVEATAQSTLTMVAGTFDVNHAIIGYQDQGNNQGTGRAFCQGTLNVHTTAVFRVNQTLELGYTTADAGHITTAEDGYGRIVMNGGGTLMASNITVGGVTKISRNNDITLTSGSQLIVTNGIGAPDAKLSLLSMNNSTLTLHVDGTRATPYVYVTNLTTSGTETSIGLAEIKNLTSDPSTNALIAYDTASPTFSLKLPTGYYGYVLNNTVNKTIDAVITTNPPSEVVWNGTVNGNWDTMTANWKSGLFRDGAPATFDDTAEGTTAVTVVGTVAPGPVLVTNNGKNYSFSGGTIAGTSLMTKEGSGTLTMDASSQLPLALNGGTATGSGSLGTTTVAPGATLNFAGSINGLISSGTVTSSGTIDNGISIEAGSFLGSGTINGPVTLGGNASATVTGTVNATGTSTVDSGATLALNGWFNNTSARLNVNGTLTGTGVVTDPDGYNLGVDGRLSINNGAVLSPGNSIGILAVWGRFDLNQGAKLVVEVDLNNPARNDMVGVDDFGNIRGIIVMTNIGAVPFAVGQSFLVVSNNFGYANEPLNPNIDFRFEPASPGLGMVWDGSDLATNGIVRIAAIISTPTNLTSVVSSNQMTLSWPESYQGWVLQQQQYENLTNVTLAATNWTAVANSQFTNQVTVTITNNAAGFYRLAHPAY